MKRSTVFDDILYAQCWEDPEMDREVFRISPGDTVCTITSGGCNALAFLADGPARVLSVDLSPYQNFLLELKRAAFRSLTHSEILEFVGVRPSDRRQAAYRMLREHLSPPARTYWDLQPGKIDGGLIHCGRYERYMAFLRRWTRALKGAQLIDAFFEEDDTDRRAALYRERWDTAGWKALTKLLLSRTTMTLLFDRAFFRFVEEEFSFGTHFAGRVQHALIDLSPKENPFLSYILLGRYFDESHLPTYLRPENYSAIRAGVDRLSVHTAGCAEFLSCLPDSSVSFFNFTNIFEWMSMGAFESMLRETWRVGKPGAMLTYRNLLVSRERPESLAGRICPSRDLADRLLAGDRSFVYRNYVVEKLKKDTPSWDSRSVRLTAAAQ